MQLTTSFYYIHYITLHKNMTKHRRLGLYVASIIKEIKFEKPSR